MKETTLSKDDLIYPVFVKEGIKTKEKIPKMPGQYRYSVDELIDEAKKLEEKGLKAILVFGIPKKKINMDPALMTQMALSKNL